jgi:hypothetical protein
MCDIYITCSLYGPRTKNRLSNMPAHALDKLFLRITYILALFPMFYSMSGEFLGAYPMRCSPALDLRVSSILRNVRLTLFLEQVSHIFSEQPFGYSTFLVTLRYRWMGYI